VPDSAAFDLVRIIEALHRHGVPAVTTDLDIVFERSDANIRGLPLLRAALDDEA
jgi:hypothetical protein